MDAVLASLRHSDQREPSAEELRRITQYLLDLSPTGAGRRNRTRRIHHFQVDAERDERTTYAPAAQGRSWLLSVSPGTVDERPVTILYQRQKDVRDWVLPADAPAVPAGYPYADRTLFDLDEPLPRLLILAPAFPTPDRLGADDLFAPVPDSARPASFRTEEMWGYDLYQASVVLSADTKTALPPGTALPVNTPFATITRRCRAHVHAVPRVDLLATGMIEVARLYLLRDPDATNGAQDDQLVVQQRLYWSLLSVQLAMTELSGGDDADPLTTFLMGGGLGGDLGPAQDIVTGTEVLFWTA